MIWLNGCQINYTGGTNMTWHAALQDTCIMRLTDEQASSSSLLQATSDLLPRRAFLVCFTD